MEEPLPARERSMRVVRHLDHDAVDARLNASLVEYGRVSRQAGLTPEEAVGRLRRLLDHEADTRPTRWRPVWRFSSMPVRQIVIGATGALLLFTIVAVGMTMRTSRGGAASEPPGPAATAAPSPGVAGFAELFVAVYLGKAGEGAEHHLEPFLSELPDLPGLAPGRLYVQNLATLAIRSDEDGWVVEVAAQVLQRMDTGYGDPVIQRYRVAVRDEGGLIAGSLPVLTGGM